MGLFNQERRSDTRLLVSFFAAASCTGCVSGSLASNTGPRPRGMTWSDVGRQKVHVGEEVRFDFVLQDRFPRRFIHPTGLADYCVATIHSERIQAEPDVFGHFQFAHTFDDVHPGEMVEVRASAYRQRGGRDYMKVRGQWMQTDSPFDEPDRRVAADSIRFTVYEASIELTVYRPAGDLEPETGVLRIFRSDGSTSSVYIDRPHRSGFTMKGPDTEGYYRILYRPSGVELNPTRTTEVEFVIHNFAGHPQVVSATIETP